MKRLFVDLNSRDRLDSPLPLGEYARRTIHHDLADFRVTDQVLNGSEERKNQIEAHQISPSSSCWKYDLFGSR